MMHRWTVSIDWLQSRIDNISRWDAASNDLHFLACQLSASHCTQALLGHPSLLTTGNDWNLAKDRRGKREIAWDRAGMDEVRRADIWTDTVQQTGNYEDIWWIHQAVMNLFGFFNRITQVSLMDKVGAGKHISVMTQCRRKNKWNSLHAFHTLSTPFSQSP